MVIVRHLQCSSSSLLPKLSCSCSLLGTQCRHSSLGKASTPPSTYHHASTQPAGTLVSAADGHAGQCLQETTLIRTLAQARVWCLDSGKTSVTTLPGHNTLAVKKTVNVCSVPARAHVHQGHLCTTAQLFQQQAHSCKNVQAVDTLRAVVGSHCVYSFESQQDRVRQLAAGGTNLC